MANDLETATDKCADPARVANRFWAKVDRRGPDECWLWTAATGAGGYGQFKLAGRTRTAHRLSLIWAKGPPEPGQQVLHACDTPRCVNPGHLRWGTHLENQRDKGRSFAQNRLARETAHNGL